MTIEEFVAAIRAACDEFLAPPPVVTPEPVYGDILIESPRTFTNQIFNGTVTVAAPDVTFANCKFVGTNPNQTILTAYHRTKVHNCDIIGSPYGQHRGVRTDADGIVITDSRIVNIWHSIDTQAIGAWDGCKNLLVDNCDLEASGENICFGGSTMSSPDSVPQDILINNCRLTKNRLWQAKPGGVTCKNLFEIKVGQRIALTNCFLQNSWVDGQDGYAILLTIRQDPRPWGRLSDVRIENNRIDMVASAVNLLGVDDMDIQPGDPMMENILFKGNVFTNVNHPDMGGGGRCFIAINGSQNLQIIDNKISGPSWFNTAFAFGGNQPPILHKGLVIKGNVLPEGNYGIHAEGAPALGKAGLDMYAPGYVWEDNTITGYDPEHYVEWPEGTRT